MRYRIVHSQFASACKANGLNCLFSFLERNAVELDLFSSCNVYKTSYMKMNQRKQTCAVQRKMSPFSERRFGLNNRRSESARYSCQNLRFFAFRCKNVKKQKARQTCVWRAFAVSCGVIRKCFSGERGIRTLGTFQYTRFPSVLDRPLWHLSSKNLNCKYRWIEINDYICPRFGAIAQLVEQRTENPCVPGSNPGDATTKKHFNQFG